MMRKKRKSPSRSGPVLTVNKRDPTRTTTLRRGYYAEINRRVRAARKDFGRVTVKDFQKDGRFWRPTLYDSIMAYTEALDKTIERHVVKNSNWQDRFIRQAYLRGIRNADSQLRVNTDDPDAAIERSNHIFTLLPIAERAKSDLHNVRYTELWTIINKTRAALEPRLAVNQPLLDPDELTDEEWDELDELIQVIQTSYWANFWNRAKKIAAFVIVAAVAEAVLSRLAEYGITRFLRQSEYIWTTAGDLQVCERCQDGESNNPYTLSQARGLIPRHPLCRCTWVIAR